MRTRFPPVAACLGNYACAKVVTRGWKCRWPVDRRRVNYREKLRRAEKLLSIPSEANYRFRCSRSIRARYAEQWLSCFYFSRDEKQRASWKIEASISFLFSGETDTSRLLQGCKMYYMVGVLKVQMCVLSFRFVIANRTSDTNDNPNIEIMTYQLRLWSYTISCKVVFHLNWPLYA